jgi:hypothetical protein
MIVRLGLALLAGVMLVALSASAQAPGTSPPPTGASTPQPVPAPKTTKPAYKVTGFRSATFGMTDAEVRAAIQKDFGVKPDAIKQTANAIERTTALVAAVPTLDPGPGPATVIYILGYQSKKLIQVNVVWARDPKAEKADTGPYMVAGLQLVNYFNEFSWHDGRVSLGIPVGPSTLLLFGAEDDKTGAVQVIADGVTIERKGEGRVEAGRQAAGQISLRVSYIANRTTPDIFRLERGRF